jgi:hypothetical protein
LAVVPSSWHARFEPPILTCGKQYRPCRPILHAPAGLKKLCLGNNSSATAIRPVQGDKRGLANKIDRRWDEHSNSRHWIEWIAGRVACGKRPMSPSLYECLRCRVRGEKQTDRFPPDLAIVPSPGRVGFGAWAGVAASGSERPLSVDPQGPTNDRNRTLIGRRSSWRLPGRLR